MLIDHIGLFFLPDMLVLRIVGRLSFPIFAWLTANGARHTQNKYKYMGRLLAFALITQPIYYATHRLIGIVDIHLNIFFTLFIGLLAIFFLQRTTFIALRVCLVMFAAGTALFLNSDYGAIGVLSIVFFYVFYKNEAQTIISQIIVYSAWHFWLFWVMVMQGQWALDKLPLLIQPFAIFSLFFIFLYNNTEGLRIKWLFYLIYPMQYVFFYFILTFLKIN